MLNIYVWKGFSLYILILFFQNAEDTVLDLRPECQRAVLTWLPNSPVPRAVSTGMSELDLMC
jgi:hypothetical protein